MKLSSDSGTFQLSGKLIISPGMLMKDILEQNVIWEPWFPRVDDIVLRYRTIINIPGVNGEIILIAYFENECADMPTIKRWLCAPICQNYGIQSQSGRKLRKDIRKWFQSVTGVALPLKEKWGVVDAVWDHHNQTADIVCHYYK